MKNVIVTGGASGIGFECAKIFSKNNYKVFVLDKNIDNMNNDKIKFFKCDVSKKNEVLKAAEIIFKELKKIDVIINCAGIQIEESFDYYSQERWQEIMNTNYFGACNTIHSFLNNMDSGSTILNLISIHSFIPRTNKYAYDSSKSALEMLTKELGIELANKNITINALSFGAVETKMNEVWERDISKKEVARKKVPLKIIFKPIQIATFAYKIVENFSEYTTGSVFIIDGGRSLM